MTDIPQQAEEHLSRLQTLAHNAAKEVQNLTGQTSYRSLTKEGLIPALQRMAEERLVQDGLKVTVEWAGDRVLPESTNVNLYRITQEALNNITRHSGAHQALVKIDLLSPLASIEIIDKGCGFDSSKVSIKKGFGLVGMVERAGEIGWSLQIEAQPCQGTRIRVEEQPS
jgi:signal transduction histidine kinase